MTPLYSFYQIYWTSTAVGVCVNANGRSGWIGPCGKGRSFAGSGHDQPEVRASRAVIVKALSIFPRENVAGNLEGVYL